MECQLSIATQESVVGIFQNASDEYDDYVEYAFPQQCELLQPFKNIYNDDLSIGVGSFVANSCGECASACVAQRMGDGFTITTADPSQQPIFDAIMASGARPCTDWVWCDPWRPSDPEGCPYGATEDTNPFTAKCRGRWRDGELGSWNEEDWDERSMGQPTYLDGSVENCRVSNGPSIPAGTCTLLNIASPKWQDHVKEDPNTRSLMSGMCDWTLGGERGC